MEIKPFNNLLDLRWQFHEYIANNEGKIPEIIKLSRDQAEHLKTLLTGTQTVENFFDPSYLEII